MISPYGTAIDCAWTGASTTGAASASGSGYGTSSGAKRATADASHTISPPDRSVRTTDSPSTRCPFTDIVRPVEKKTSSARAGDADARTAVASAAVRNVFIMRGMRLFYQGLACPLRRFSAHHSNRRASSTDRLDERMEDADAQLTRILAV